MNKLSNDESQTDKRKLTLIIKKGEHMKSVEESSLSCTSTSGRKQSLNGIAAANYDDYKTAPEIKMINLDKSLSTEQPFKKHESQEYITDQAAASDKPLEPCIQQDVLPRPSTSGIGRKKVTH